MKIGIDCHNLEGQRTGVGRYLWNLLKEWHRQKTVYNVHDREHCIQFFLYFKSEIPREIQRTLPYSHDRENIVERSWNFKLLNGKSNALFKHWLLPHAAIRDKADVLFCPDYVLPICLPRRIKTAVTIHDIIYEARPDEYSWPSWADKILLKWASKQSAKAADIIFVPSEFTKNEILKYYKVTPEKIMITPLAPDPVFRRLKLPSSLAEGEGGGQFAVEYKKYILFVGSIFNRRFLPQKIKGFTMFAKDHQEFKFLIVGKNHTKPYQDIGTLIKKANQELGREAVIWREHATDEELVYLYNGAFATLWLSSYEGFGLPVLESMACGTPVITCRAGSLPEAAGNAAMHIENPQNPEEIQEALERLLADKNYYYRLVEVCLTQTQKFSWKSCAQSTLNNVLKLI